MTTKIKRLLKISKFSYVLVSYTLDFFIKLVGVFSLLLLVIQYWAERQEFKETTSMKFISEFYSKNTVKDQRVLFDELAEIAESLMREKDISIEEMRRRYYHRMINMTRADRSKKDIVDYQMNLFERIANCLEVGLCKDNVIKTFFKNDGKRLFISILPYVCNRRENEPDDRELWKAAERFLLKNREGSACEEYHNLFKYK